MHSITSNNYHCDMSKVEDVTCGVTRVRHSDTLDRTRAGETPRE
jgi:hypothetical protein